MSDYLEKYSDTVKKMERARDDLQGLKTSLEFDAHRCLQHDEANACKRGQELGEKIKSKERELKRLEDKLSRM